MEITGRWSVIIFTLCSHLTAISWHKCTVKKKNIYIFTVVKKNRKDLAEFLTCSKESCLADDLSRSSRISCMFSEEKKLSVLAVSKKYIEEFTENNTWQSFFRSVLGAWYTTIWKFGLVRFLMFWKFYTHMKVLYLYILILYNWVCDE